MREVWTMVHTSFLVSGLPGGSKFEENSCLGKRHPNGVPSGFRKLLRPKGLEMEGVPYRAALDLWSLATKGTQEIGQNLIITEQNIGEPKNKGELKAERAEMLERLLSLCEEYKRVNQWG